MNFHSLRRSFAQRCEQAKAQRIDLTDGESAWLITGYDEARGALTDPRLSSDGTRSPRVAKMPAEVREKLLNDKSLVGGFIAMDAPRHAPQRKTVSPLFTPPHLAQLAILPAN